MKIREIITALEAIAPISYQESYDNCGLIVGDPERKVSKALICLDSTEAVIDEAIAQNCDLIIAHHPIVFRGLKKFNGKNYVERTVIKAIKNDIAIYAIHTNLDNVHNGVNAMLAKKLGLTNTRILQPKSEILKKLVVFVPAGSIEEVSEAIHQAGAGHIGNYSETGFRVAGTGTFRGNENSTPVIGKVGEKEEVAEYRFETIYPSHMESRVLRALFKSHPYEEVAYDIIPLGNSNPRVGAGMIGELAKPMETKAFLNQVKEVLNCGMIRHTKLISKKISKIALCGGAGSFLLPDALRNGADLYLSGDFKYHEFFDAEDRIVIADVGHYESEQYTKDLLYELIREKFPTFALRISKTNTNPVKYL